MTKQEFIHAIEAGAVMPVDSTRFSFPELVRMARAAQEHGFTLEIRNSTSLIVTQISHLGSNAPGHVSFPDFKF